MDKISPDKKRLMREMLRVEKRLKELEEKHRYLDMVEKYKIKEKNDPYMRGNLVYGSCNKIRLLTKVKPRKDLYYISLYVYSALTEIKGDTFRAEYAHITKEQLEQFVYAERTNLYTHRCHMAFHFMQYYSKKNGNKELIKWGKTGIDICRACAAKME
jgi:hypothetical protein